MALHTFTAKELADARELIALDIGSTGDWRSRVQDEYPEDRRNTEAADVLSKLEASVADVPDDLIVRYMTLWQSEHPAYEGDHLYDLTEDWSRKTREIGFWSMPSSAQKLVEEFVTDWEAKLTPPQKPTPKQRHRAIRS